MRASLLRHGKRHKEAARFRPPILFLPDLTLEDIHKLGRMHPRQIIVVRDAEVVPTPWWRLF